MVEQEKISAEEARIRCILENVPDPEIPVLTVNDLGIIRGIKVVEPLRKIEVCITPTYSGCPAMDMIATNIRMELLAAGYAEVHIKTVLSPAWTTDWISEYAKQKLKAYGIAPPQQKNEALFSEPPAVECPQCHSLNTYRISEFGSTACKSLYQCRDCGEPFDLFKCH
jgi:ring-1,2-phenylacetyl-CoA epoxidase subunit PaaD